MGQTQLGVKPVGSIVKLREDGQWHEYLIVHQGNPDPNIYDTSCNGTWLLRRYCVDKRQWSANKVNDYEKSTIQSWLNREMLQKFDISVQKLIKQVRIPYRRVSGTVGIDFTGSRGLQCKCFLLGASEVGWANIFGSEGGIALDYFKGFGTRDSRRCTTYNGKSISQWLRTPHDGSTEYVVTIDRDEGGYFGRYANDTEVGVQPALILSQDILVNSDNTVTGNSSPVSPSSINLPSAIKGGALCSVSWSAATDPDGNLEGYIVERSYNGGSSWSQIYQGSATSTSTTIPHGTSTVMFRVCAYDTDGEKSGWRTSSNKTVLNNRAPNAPPSINVPMSPQGGASVSVTWSASSDPDGNLEGYRLERQWDGAGAFDQIYQGSGLSYTDTIPKGAHTSVTYRVRAYDAFGETSGYTTSPVRTIDNNLAPVIQCDLSGNLGDKSEGFVVPYTVTDAENHAVTVTERVGNLVKRTYSVTLGQSNSFQITGDYFQKILNGEQAAEIIATDTEGKSSTLSLTFTKKVHRASIMLSEPLTVENPITVCVIKVVGNIPEDAEFKVEVANNLGDESPAWEDATDAAKRGINHVFKNKTQVNGWKFGFRVTAERGASDTAGYMTSIQGGFQ